MLVALGACAQPEPNDVEDDALTSATALQRALTFEGKVYAPEGSSESQILSLIQAQTRTAFGALKNVFVGVNTRELKEIDPKTIVKRSVSVVDTDGKVATSQMLEVQYRYSDSAVVPKAMAKRTAIPLALLRPDYGADVSKVLSECTKNDAEARQFASQLWYVFEPSLPGCQAVLQRETARLVDASAKLSDPKVQVTLAEARRLYVPTTMRLAAADTNTRPIYPEYDKLYAGGVEAGVLNVALVQGLGSHDAGPAYKDESYRDFHWALKAIFEARPGFRYVKSEPTQSFEAVTVRGVRVPLSGFEQLMHWEVTKSPTGLPNGLTGDDVRAAGAELIVDRWHIFEAPVRVTTRGVKADRLVRIHAYFGDTSSRVPYARALKSADVVVYNGHSYIGNGPMDPANFQPSDLSTGYQLFFFNSCVSYNYYEKGYFALKAGGTRNLDMITNGLEAPVWDSGRMIGRIVGALLNGKQESYQNMLKAGALPFPTAPGGGKDPLRVVDGELDNLYNPASLPMVVTAR